MMDWPNKVNTQAIRVNILQMKLESKFYLGKLGQHRTVETKANKKWMHSLNMNNEGNQCQQFAEET